MDVRSPTEVLGRVAALLREKGGDLSPALEETAGAVGADFVLLLSVSPSEGKSWLLSGHGLSHDPGQRPGELSSPYLFRQVTLAPEAPYELLRHGWEEDPFLGREGAVSLLLSVHHAEGLHFSLVAGRRGKTPFDIKAGELFSVLSQFLGFAAERRYLQAEVARWRDRDPLTGLAVYHSFYDTLRREVARSRRQGRKVSLAILSVEGIEEVAAKKGRGAADGILRSVAEELSHNMRDNDFVGRYGPTEFGLLLTDVSSSIGRMVADRLLRGVNEKVKDPRGAVSFRMGYSCYPEEATTTEKLIEMCEGALAKAREAESRKAVRWKK
jgi:diguanylate cyclase (GGDEF)-like protein